MREMKIRFTESHKSIVTLDDQRGNILATIFGTIENNPDHPEQTIIMANGKIIAILNNKELIDGDEIIKSWKTL
jgi:hypothetical protein